MDDKLSVKIVADVSDLKKELDKIGKHVDKFAVNAKNDMKDFSQSVALATVKFQELTNIAKSSAAAVYEFMRAQIDSSRETALWATRLDVAVDTFSQLVVVGRKFGATADDVGDSIKDLNERIADAARGNQTYESALKLVGLTSQTLINMPVE